MYHPKTGEVDRCNGNDGTIERHGEYDGDYHPNPTTKTRAVIGRSSLTLKHALRM